MDSLCRNSCIQARFVARWSAPPCIVGFIKKGRESENGFVFVLYYGFEMSDFIFLEGGGGSA